MDVTHRVASLRSNAKSVSRFSSELVSFQGATADEVVIDFGESYGIWVFLNNSSWVELDDLSPESMVMGDIDGNGQNDLIVDFGIGLGISVWLNNTSWVNLHNVSPESMVTGDMDGN